MADNKIISSTTFNAASDMKYGKPRAYTGGKGKSIPILNSETNKQLYISTPLMLSWGIEEYVDDSSRRKSYSMALQFPRDDYCTPETDAFLKSMQDLERRVKADAVTNSREWMNKHKMSPDVVEALMTPILRYSKDPETGEPDLTRSPTMRVKLDYWEEKFNCEIYNLQQDPLFPSDDPSDPGPMELIPKGTNTAVVLKCGGIWFAGGKFGVTWRLFQAVVKPRASLKGKCHIQLSSADTTRLANQVDIDVDDDTETGVELADTSDEEDDETSIKEEVTTEVSQAVANTNETEDTDTDTVNDKDVPSFTSSNAANAKPKKVKAAVKKKKKVVKRSSPNSE